MVRIDSVLFFLFIRSSHSSFALHILQILLILLILCLRSILSVLQGQVRQRRIFPGIFGLLITQADDVTRALAAVLIYGCIVFAGRIDIFMAEHICNQIDVSCGPVEACAVGAAQFVRSDLFE